MKKNSFVEGSLIATFAIIFTKILGMLYVIPFYSIIGSQGSALYSYAYNIYMIFLSISSAGIPTAMSKIVSEYESKELRDAKVRTFKIGILIIGLLSIICFIVLLFFSENIAKLIVGDISNGGNSLQDITMVIFVISFAVLIIPFLSVARGYLQGHKYIKPSSDSQMLEQIVRIIVILAGSYTAIKLLKLNISYGVAVAVSGAFFGGLAAIFYILKKIIDNKTELSLGIELKKDKVTNKEILKKIVYYSLPFIIINITVNIYNTVDMSLIIRTLSKIGYNGADSEFIAGVVTTWGYKLNMIVNAIATGLTISLIPNIVSSYTTGKHKEVNRIFNKALQIVLFVSIPAATGLSFLATPVWVSFYGPSHYGPIVFRFTILTAIFCNVYLIAIQTAQSLNKYKSVYIAVIGGTLLNACLDVPMMYLCNKLGIYPFYGATISTIIGYLFSITFVLFTIKRMKDINYKSTWNTLFKLLLSLVAMLIVLSILKIFVPLTITNRIKSILQIALYAVVGAITYFIITYKLGIINELFGQNMINKVFKIITFGKYKGAKNDANKEN
ncbi:MAG: polysaccharide biosynthesis protein [Bacilli bacterium]|nr:polysaccharide biosynthesis protein [Bacilli bacterium]